MRCRTNASTLAKALATMRPNKIFNGFLMEAVGDTLIITNANDSCISCFQIDAEVMESGVVAPDLRMMQVLLKGIGDKTVELSLNESKTRLKVTFTAENGHESTYLIPALDPDRTTANIVEDLKFEDAEPFAYFHSDQLLKSVLSSMKPLLSNHSRFNTFLFIPEENFVKILTIQDAIIGYAEVPAEVPDEVVSNGEPLAVPREITQVPVSSIGKLSGERPWVVAISDRGYAAFPTVHLDDKQVIQRALNLVDYEAALSMKTSGHFWQQLRKTIAMHRSQKKKSYRSDRLKIDFDFESQQCYCWTVDVEPTIVSVMSEFPTVAEQRRSVPAVLTFDCELIGSALEFISKPDTIDFLVLSDTVSGMRLRFGSWVVVMASMLQGSDYRNAQARQNAQAREVNGYAN